MPILLKKIDGSIISLFDSNSSDYVGDLIFIKNVVGEIGIEDYILMTAFEGLVQNFSNVIEAEFCETTPVNFGPNECSTYTDLSLSY
jgi:hypothetical protein